MAFTTTPAYWQDWVVNKLAYLNNVMNQGIVELVTKTTTGDTMWRWPVLSSLDSVMTTETVVTTSSTVTPDGLADYYEYMPVLHRKGGVRIYDINKADKGIDIWPKLAAELPETILNNFIQPSIKAMLTGWFTTAGALRSTHFSDESLSSISGQLLKYEAVNLLGEVALTFDKVIIHPAKLTELESEILAQPLLMQNGDTIIQQFLGNKRLIVNESICAKIGDAYPAYVIGGSPIRLGWEKTVEVESQRNALSSYTDWLAEWYYAIGGRGLNYAGAANPANTVIDDAGSWTLVGPSKQTTIVQILTK